MSAQRTADGDSLLSLILRQLEAIKFVTDWKIIGQQRGGKKYKGAFARSVYEARTGRPLPNPNHCSKEARADFKMFKIRQQTLIAGRNILLDMYNEVRLSFHVIITLTVLLNIQFGVAVLLDNVWNADGLGNCSKMFRAVFDALRASRPAGNTSACQDVLKSLVQALSGGDFSDYITGLLQELSGPSDT